MKDFLIALRDDSACGATPVMPFIGERFDGGYFARQCKLHTEAALLRCGFDIFDCSGNTDQNDLAVQIARRGADALINLSYAVFGSGKSFNDVHGFRIRTDGGRFAARSRTLGEDIFSKLALGGRCGTIEAAAQGASVMPTVTVEAGYCTYFDEAKLIFDPDFAVEIAESIAMALCEHFDIPFVRRDDISSYPMLCLSRRGKKVKMLQALLNTFGANLERDGVFGAKTDAAVKQFCLDNGESVANVTPSVWSYLLGIPDGREIRRGARLSSALYIQKKLKSKLYNTPIDGVFGDETLAALNDFLKDAVGAECKIDADEAIGTDIIKLLSPVGGGKPRLF